MTPQIEELSDAGGTNNLLEFISTYFPFIDEPMKLRYHGRTYKLLATQAKKIQFEDFFISFDCFKCTKSCCNNMCIPLGFETYWPEEQLKKYRTFKPRKYSVWFNDRKMKFIIGLNRYCKWNKRRVCTMWDGDSPTQTRPLGCIVFPITWYWNEGTVIFTKHCDPFLCTSESTRYTEEDFARDLNVFEKICRELEAVGFPVNYRPIDALKESVYFSI